LTVDRADIVRSRVPEEVPEGNIEAERTCNRENMKKI